MVVAKKEAPRRGRPFTGKAKTSTERGKELEATLRASGGRILSRVRLSPEAAKALEKLSPVHGSDRTAIEVALIDAAKKIK